MHIGIIAAAQEISAKLVRGQRKRAGGKHNREKLMWDQRMKEELRETGRFTKLLLHTFAEGCAATESAA